MKQQPEPPRASTDPALAPLALSERIRQRLADMTPSERRIARALLSGPPTIGLESSARLAKHVGVSGPTVSRFANRVGFANYAAFQRALHDDIAARVMSPVEVYRKHVDTADDNVLVTAGSALGTAVESSLHELSPVDFWRATTYLSDTRRQVMVVGGWFSHLLGGYLAARLREFRPRVRHIPPVASDRAAAIADLGRRDVVVIFDFRRYERDTLEFAQAVRETGVMIVLFTDPWLSPTSDLAPAVLPS
jgi:DNA-binding MurR/RpiR family transcriptional regulator